MPEQPPRWVQESRAARGRDPRSGRRPEKAGTPLLGGLVSIAVTLGALALFVWFVVAMLATLLG